MKFILTFSSVALIALAPGWVLADVLTLSPASPQPSGGALAPGLAVQYAPLPRSARNLSVAISTLDKKGTPGIPLSGLSYDDTSEGDPVLTSDRKQLVGAAISGFIRFDAPGSYVLDFLTNDGLEISIGGQEVGRYDGTHACGYAGEVEVEVPQAGYYPVEATYFQRKGTACLMMEWGRDSAGLELVSDEAFFHAK